MCGSGHKSSIWMSVQAQFVKNVKSALNCFVISIFLHVLRFLLVSQLSKNQNSLAYFLLGLSSHCNGLWYLFHVFFAFFVIRLTSLNTSCTLSNAIILCHVLYFNCVLFIVLDSIFSGFLATYMSSVASA